MSRLFTHLAVLLAALALSVNTVTAAGPSAGPTVWVVAPEGPLTSIAAALAQAQPGDTIEVHGGRYPALVVDKSISLLGLDWPLIDGGEAGTVVQISAPNVVLSGFDIQGSGIEPDQDHGGITITAAHVTVSHNRLSDVLFGIFVSQADDARVLDNDITSKTQYDEGRKGDGIRLWYSQRVLVENNHVHDARDVVMWYSSQVVVRGNIFEGGRYGLHLMYCDDADIEQNQIRNNSVGIYTMYSRGISLHANDLRGQRGPSGYALGFKDADAVTATDNVLVDNRAGLFIDGTPFSPDSFGHFENNIFAFNDVGVILLTAVHGNTFTANTFWENQEQMAQQGGGGAGDNNWSGNFWSDYTGFDADGDGRGDTPYHSERFFENLDDREPLLRTLNYSPAVQTLELAAASFPIFKPQPKLTDPSPRLEPGAIPSIAQRPARSAGPMNALGLGLLLLTGLVGLIAFPRSRPGRSAPAPDSHASKLSQPMPEPPLSPPILQIEDLSKRYGSATALDGISFSAQPGEAVALWGINGAGKTTLLKAVLGLIDFKGSVSVQACDVRRAGKAARHFVGYVPQEAVFYDMSVQATLAFYARLKGVSPARIPALVEKLGLASHLSKAVPALSGGLKQRLALAIALLADPPVLLLDEPTANLDAAARRDYLALLVSLHKEGKTLLFASHRVDEVETLADRVVMLEAGRVAQTLTPGEVRLRLAPQVELTLWVSDSQRVQALECVRAQGFNARLNGRGTVVVQLPAQHKLQPLTLLAEQGIAVLDFEMERGHLWN